MRYRESPARHHYLFYVARQGGLALNRRGTWAKPANYRYAVDGKSYKGTRVRSRPLFVGEEGWSKAQVAKYPLFTTVTVYFDPTDPEN